MTEEHVPPELVDLLPSNTTRVETALSRFPIHNLTKSEKIDIRIVQKSDSGDTDVYWSVSPSRDFGEPRQLAYKLDTLLINRRIDSSPRPLPKIIKLGSLREICKELELSAGKGSGDVKSALQQNASAFITAKVSFRGADGIQHRFEASFTRYSLRFYGQTLPDGKRADAVYIILNDEYWALLNRAQFRPVNYDYLRQLTPSAQRFYEIVSYKMFAAISQRRDLAKLRYSEYCLRAPQLRYLDGVQMRKQMYKIHLPHVRSSYIQAVQYRSVLDEEGQPDWEMLYAPGKKARAEHYGFTRDIKVGAKSRGEEMKVEAIPATQNLWGVQALVKRGISEKKAKSLLESLPESQPIQQQLLWADKTIAASRSSFRNPPGFYIHVLESNIVPPEEPAVKPRGIGKPIVEKQESNSYRNYKSALLDSFIETDVGLDRFKDLVLRKENEFQKHLGSLKAETISEVALSTVRASILKSMKYLSEEEFALEQRLPADFVSGQPCSGRLLDQEPGRAIRRGGG